MNIPKSFKVFGTEVNIIIDDETLFREDVLGDSDYCTSTIKIATKYKGKDISKDVILDTYYHEKVHHILDSMREFKLSKNEKFVDVFSKLLRQSDETSKY